MPRSLATALFAVGATTAVQVPPGTWPVAVNRARATGGSRGGGPAGMVAFPMTFPHSALSPTAALSAPTITAPPADRVMGVDTGTTVPVAVTGSPTLRHEGKRDGTAIDPATTATLVFAPTRLSAADADQADVSNDVGTTPGRIATLVVPTALLPHSAATGGDYPIGLVGRTPVIQFYDTRLGATRTGASSVAGALTGAGFATDRVRPQGTVLALTRYQASGTNPDGVISRVELTRGIELYPDQIGRAHV